MATNIPSRQIASIPTDIVDEMSPTWSASKCFAEQKFSSKLQQFLVDYSLNVSISQTVLSDSPQYPLPKKDINAYEGNLGNNIA